MREIRVSPVAVLLPALILWLAPAHAQLPGSGAAAVGMGNNYTALARGLSATGMNPAGLAMPGSPGFSLSLFPVQGQQSLSPISLADFSEFGGQLIPDVRKEAWLGEIASAGGETGAAGAEITPLVFHAGPVGLRLSTLVGARAALNEDAAELLLFGNAGRTGSPRDFNLQGSSLDAFAVSTLGVSLGLPLGNWLGAPPGRSLAAGATLKYSVGHALLLGRDAGSRLRSNPLEVALAFPVLQPDTESPQWNQGSGVGVDLGFAWEEGAWAAGIALQNLVHTFRWELEKMSFRPGEALFDKGGSSSDFDPKPASQAPAFLREAADAMSFKPVLALGGAYRFRDGLTLSADLRKRFGEGIQPDPALHVGGGLEFRPVPFVPLRAGGALVTDGFQVGGGFGIYLGPLRLDWAGLIRRGDVGEGNLAMFSLAFGG